MHFGYTIIYVADVESTLSFYEKAFNLKRSFIHDSKQYGELDTGDTKLAFASESLAESNGIEFTKNNGNNLAVGFEIGLITNNVAEAYTQACNEGASAIKEPTEKPWGQIVAYVRDLNGILIEICSPILEKNHEH